MTGRVDVWQTRRGSWVWRYTHDADTAGTPLELPSATDYASRDAAVSAARTAYPGVPVEVELPPPDPRAAAVTRALRRTGAAAAVLGGLAIAMVLAVSWRRNR